MKPVDVEVARNPKGVFATVRLMIAGKMFTETIWSKTGKEADPYENMPDHQIRMIALAHWNRLKKSALRRRRGYD